MKPSDDINFPDTDDAASLTEDDEQLMDKRVQSTPKTLSISNGPIKANSFHTPKVLLPSPTENSWNSPFFDAPATAPTPKAAAADA